MSGFQISPADHHSFHQQSRGISHIQIWVPDCTWQSESTGAMHLYIMLHAGSTTQVLISHYFIKRGLRKKLMKKKTKMVILLIFHFNTFLCKLIVFQLCSKIKFALFLLLEMPAVRVAGSQPETNHTFSVNQCFICDFALSA